MKTLFLVFIFSVFIYASSELRSFLSSFPNSWLSACPPFRKSCVRWCSDLPLQRQARYCLTSCLVLKDFYYVNSKFSISFNVGSHVLFRNPKLFGFFKRNYTLARNLKFCSERREATNKKMQNLQRCVFAAQSSTDIANFKRSISGFD